MPQDSKLTDLTKIKEAVNFYDLALYFQEECLKEMGDRVMMCCPDPDKNGHKDDTPSFSYNLDRKAYWCFGCNASGDIFDYVMSKFPDFRFKDSVDFLIKFAGLDPSKLEGVKELVPQYKKEMRALKSMQPKDKPNFDYFSEEMIKEMIPKRGTHFLERGLSKETLDFFEVGFHDKYQRVILPVRDERGVLIGATGRTIYPDYKERKIPKWQHYKNTNISKTFFNINNAIEASKSRKNSVIMCEGPNDVMKLHEYGYNNTIACLSNSMSKSQKTCLLKNFISIYLFLDGDRGGEVGRERILEEISGYFNIYNVYGIEGKDPDEMTKEEVDNAIRSARKI